MSHTCLLRMFIIFWTTYAIKVSRLKKNAKKVFFFRSLLECNKRNTTKLYIVNWNNKNFGLLDKKYTRFCMLICKLDSFIALDNMQFCFASGIWENILYAFACSKYLLYLLASRKKKLQQNPYKMQLLFISE